MPITFFEPRNTVHGSERQPTIGEYTLENDEDCAFCVVKEPQDRSAFDLAWPMGKIALKPALGTLVPGYMLAITQEHATSFAQLPAADLSVIDCAMQAFEADIDPVITGEYIRFEHGSDNVDACGIGAGACVDHAHQHIVPAEKAAARMLDELAWDELESFTDLADYRGRPYMYMSFEGRHFAKSEPKLGGGNTGRQERRLPSQWGRQVIAEMYDTPMYDWALRRDATNLAITLMMHNLLPAGQLRLDLAHDRLDYHAASHGDAFTALTILDPDENPDEMGKIWAAWQRH